MKTPDKNKFIKRILVRKHFVFLIIIAFTNYMGCYSIKQVSGQNIRKELISHDNQPLNILTEDYTEYKFESNMYTVKNDSLIGMGKVTHLAKESSFNGKIAIADIIEVKFKNRDTFSAFAIVLGITAIIVLATLAIVLVSEDY